MIRARVDLGSQEEPPQLCCQPVSLSCQTSCPAPRPGGHPRLRLRCEEQTPGPMSHVSLPRTRGPVCGKGQEVIWVQAETTPPRVKGVMFSFLSFGCRAPPNRMSTQRPVWHSELPRCQSSPAQPLPAPNRPYPSLLHDSVSLLGRLGQPAPACWVPANCSLALGASSPACRPHTHLLSLCSSVSSRGDLEAGVTPPHDSPTTQPATSGCVGCLQTSACPAAAPRPLCASVGLRTPPKVLMALPSPGTAQASSSAPKGPCHRYAQPIPGCGMKTPEAGWLIDNKHFFLTVSEAGSLRPGWRQGLLTASFQVAGSL